MLLRPLAMAASQLQAHLAATHRAGKADDRRFWMYFHEIPAKQKKAKLSANMQTLAQIVIYGNNGENG